jgi:hypothetical protein
MGDGLDRAGYKQIAGAVDAIFITDTMGKQTGDWTDISLLTAAVNFTSIAAVGMANSSRIDSATTYAGYGAKWQCSKITSVHVKVGHVIAHNRVLL